MCEVPTITGEYGNVYIDLNFSSPYSARARKPILNDVTGITVLRGMT